MTEPAFTSAIRLLEDSLALAKRADATAWFVYLCGVVPFFGFLLFALTDFSQGPFAADHLVSYGFVLAVLFYWLHICQSVFCALLYGTLTENPCRMAGCFPAAFRTQVVVAGAKLLLWPIGLALLVPHSTVTSFFQHSLLAPDGGRSGNWHQTVIIGKADTRYRPLVALWSLVIVLLLRGILWVNLLALMFVLPQLWKVFTGIEGTVTRAPEVLFNPTSIAALCTLAYIGLDPIVKAMFVLRHFARQAETSGDDLRLRLALARKTAAAAFLLLALITVPRLSSAEQDAPKSQITSVAPDQMKQAIRSVFRDPANTWNLPAVQHKAQKKDAFTAFMDSVMSGIDKLWNAVTSSVSRLIHWIRGLLSNSNTSTRNKAEPVSKRNATLLLAFFGSLLVLALLVAVFEKRKRPKLRPTITIGTMAKSIDLHSEEADPLDQSESEWRKLANQYRAEGNFRLALRALYLGTLATLAEKSLVSPARGKTNSEYVRELQRRAKRLGGEFVSVFVTNTRLFERSWYGTYPATDEIVQNFEQNVLAMQKQLS